MFCQGLITITMCDRIMWTMQSQEWTLHNTEKGKVLICLQRRWRKNNTKRWYVENKRAKSRTWVVFGAMHSCGFPSACVIIFDEAMELFTITTAIKFIRDPANWAQIAVLPSEGQSKNWKQSVETGRAPVGLDVDYIDKMFSFNLSSAIYSS